MKWELKIKDPSGETRTVRLPTSRPFTLGKSPEADVVLRDLTLPECVAEGRFISREETFWIKLADSAPLASLGNLSFREAEFPPETVIRLGETTLSIEKVTDLPLTPVFPSASRPWHTRSESGTRLLWQTKKAASTPLSVYIAGETGTGKEVIAELLHAWSDRAMGPLVPLHCGALATSLAESELFGHVKGAFTGAAFARTGALLQAHGGTLFLDEVGDLSSELQVKLLRFLENGEVRPVGSDQIRHADVRIICATHLPLKKLVEEGKFRRDLYFRLASVTLTIPDLRSRPEDIALLATKYAQELGKTILPRTLLRLKAYGWPGNVRELRHAIERACGMAGPFQEIIDESAFEFLLSPEAVEKSVDLEVGPATLTLHEMERVMIRKALRLSYGNRTNAARMLGVARSTLFEMLKRHRIQGPRWTTSAQVENAAVS